MKTLGVNRNALAANWHWAVACGGAAALAAAAVCALADRDRYRAAVLATLRHYDYDTPNISEFFHAAIAASAL